MNRRNEPHASDVLVVFVHGWGVRHPDYGTLPQRFARVFGADLTEIWLSEYISYNDTITMNDLANAFERARLQQFPDREFACVTHSTGGPVLRTWLDRHTSNNSNPLTHLIMLAPPTHGSALAQLGKGRLSRMKSWFEGIEPGQRILDWLEMGSDESWQLAKHELADSQEERRAAFTCVVTGASPDRSLYDHLNSYTGEHGSDGVVRIPAANPNYTWRQFAQTGPELRLATSRRSPSAPFIVLPGASHSGIQRASLDEGPTSPTSMLIMKIFDTSGEPVHDFDLLFTAGPSYSPDALPQGFLLDRQRNQRSPNTLTFFFDYAVLASTREFGFIITPRPDSGPVHYAPAEYRGTLFLQPDETTMLEIVLDRRVEDNVFALKRG